MYITKQMDYEEVKQAILNSSHESSVYLGCDSQNIKDKTVFGLTVVIHNESHKGANFFVQLSKTNKITSLRQRLMKEVEMAVEGAFSVADYIGDRKFEVHLDINADPEYKSNAVCKEAIGYVIGQGFDCKVKPEAFAASCVADYCIKK